MSDKDVENQHTADIMKPFYDFRKVVEEYAYKTSDDREQAIYGYYQLRSNDPENPKSPQEKYMKELRDSLDKYESYLLKFIEKHPDIPIEIHTNYLDHNASNPEEHHIPFTLKVEAKFGKQPEKMADILVSTFDYRGLPDITIRFGNREIYCDRFGKAYETAVLKKLCQQNAGSVSRRLQIRKDKEVLNPTPQPKLKYKTDQFIAKILSVFSKSDKEK